MPHAETHAVILPHAVAYNAFYTKEAIARVAKAMGVEIESVARELFDLAKESGAPVRLLLSLAPAWADCVSG